MVARRIGRWKATMYEATLILWRHPALHFLSQAFYFLITVLCVASVVNPCVESLATPLGLPGAAIGFMSAVLIMRNVVTDQVFPHTDFLSNKYIIPAP